MDQMMNIENLIQTTFLQTQENLFLMLILYFLLYFFRRNYCGVI